MPGEHPLGRKGKKLRAWKFIRRIKNSSGFAEEDVKGR
jgi:hypothetical protein